MFVLKSSTYVFSCTAFRAISENRSYRFGGHSSTVNVSLCIKTVSIHVYQIVFTELSCICIIILDDFESHYVRVVFFIETTNETVTVGVSPFIN